MNHWKNGRTHREEYPNFTIEQYVARAVQLAEMPVGGDILGHVDKDGIIIRYDRKINDFVKASVKKGIRTMFKPVDGESYYKDMRISNVEERLSVWYAAKANLLNVIILTAVLSVIGKMMTTKFDTRARVAQIA